MVQSISNALGYGSGIDTVQLVSDLSAASRDPKVKRLDALENANNAKISALAQLRSDLDSFASSLENVVTGGDLRSQISTSDDTALSAATSAGVSLGNMSAAIEITQLARAQTVYSGFVATGGTVGQGNMTLTVGSTSYPVTIGAANDSMTGLADAINATNSGVRASVVQDGASSRLVLKGPTGAASAFTLTADSGADPALDRFAYGGTGSQMILGRAALDAMFNVDGIAYTRPSNVVSDIMPGVTLTLKKADPGNPVSLTTQRATDQLKSTIADFVSVFNAVKSDLSAARKENGGDSALRTFERQLNGLITANVTSHADVNSLTDIGISFAKDGSLTIDNKKLDAAIAANPDAVEALFNPVRDVTHSEATDPGLLVSLKKIRDGAEASDGSLQALKSRLEKQAASITANRGKMEEREDAYKSRLERQFSAMETRLSLLKATQSYLKQQIDMWSKSDS